MSADDGLAMMHIATDNPIAETLRSFLLRQSIRPCDIDAERVASIMFESMRSEAELLLESPFAAPMVRGIVLSSSTLSEAMGKSLASRLVQMDERDAMAAALASELSQPALLGMIVADVAKAVEADPAVSGVLQPTLLFKGLQAVTIQRVAHRAWIRGDRGGALLLQSRASEAFGVDIHPAASIGRGLFLDHATAIVIGATAVVEDDVAMLHGVTLGATGESPYTHT